MGEEGKLYYCGYPIQEIAAKSTFEEVCFLLWNQRLPNATEARALKKELTPSGDPEARLEPPQEVPRTPSMVALRSAISALGAFDPDGEDNSLEANRGRRSAWSPSAPPSPRPGSTSAMAGSGEAGPEALARRKLPPHAFGRKPSAEDEHILDVAFVLHADHDMTRRRSRRA